MSGFGSCLAEGHVEENEAQQKHFGTAKTFFRTVAPMGLHLDCAFEEDDLDLLNKMFVS